jgi:Tfp pilus assembly protein PilN
LGGALVVGTLWHAVVLTRYLLREAEELDVTVQGMEERRASLVADINRTRAALEAERSDVMSQRVAFLADTYRQKGFSWTGLFNQLEAVVPPNVRITSISPSAAEGEIEVRLTIVGRSLEDLLTLVRNLEQSRFFGTVMPLNEAQQEEEGTVSSTVTLRYHAEEPAAELETVQDEAIEPTEPSETDPTEEDPLEDEDLIEDNDA